MIPVVRNNPSSTDEFEPDIWPQALQHELTTGTLDHGLDRSGTQLGTSKTLEANEQNTSMSRD
jgi:hypothetical protein